MIRFFSPEKAGLLHAAKTRLQYLLSGVLLCGLSAAACAATTSPPTTFVLRENGQINTYTISRNELSPVTVNHSFSSASLGSTWKLFVYSYLVTQHIDAPDYQCKGNNQEEVYCCQPGGSIGRETALQQSCGLFFEPKRLGLRDTAWKEFWTAQHAPVWLHSLSAMNERTKVPVAELIEALESVPEEAQQQASNTLLSVLAQKQAQNAFNDYGGLLRGKTWTMPDPQQRGMRLGGAAGWLADGRAFWLGGQGAGIEVVRNAGPALGPYIDNLINARVRDDEACVEVDFFSRYPLKTIKHLPDNTDASTGPLQGRYRIEFKNGNAIDISSNGELRLEKAARPTEAGQLIVSGRMGVNEYVARVIDREAAPEPLAAARALAVTARTYLVQQAERRQGCYAIADSSQTQRVSPRVATQAARRIANWSSSLIVAGTPVRYHLEKASTGVLSWQNAVKQAQSGMGFQTILAHAYPGSSLGSMYAPEREECQRLQDAEQWLTQNVARWRKRLQSMAGYNELNVMPVICLATMTNPYADTQRQRIYVHGWHTQEQRIALAHEYLHLAFEGHPDAYDESKIENLARQLIMQ